MIYVDRAITERLLYLVSTNARPQYIHCTELVLRAFARECPAHVQEITPRLVSGYLIRKLQECRASTVATYRVILVSWLNWCASEGYCEAQQWYQSIPCPRQDRPLPRSLSSEDVRRLLAVAECLYRPGFTRIRNAAMLYVLLDTGVRVGELCRMTPADVDAPNRAIHISAESKTRRERTVFYGESTANRLRRYMRLRPARGTALWTTSGGQRLDRTTVLRVVRRAGLAAGIGEITAHQLRHTFATQALRNGMNLAIVSRLMGHSTVKMTERYLGLMTDDLKCEYDRCGVLG